jgi:DUF917 family protein
MIKEGKKLRIIDVDDMNEDEWSCISGCFGVPEVLIEQLLNGDEITTAFKEIVKRFPDKKITSTLSIEIGGLNSLIPFVIGGYLNLPILDIDTMGRAYPELS